MFMSSEQMRRLSIDVPLNMHALIKDLSSFDDQSIKDFVLEAIKARLEERARARQKAIKEEYRRFNELTEKTLRMADRGEDLHAYESLDDFVAEMDTEIAQEERRAGHAQ